MQMELFLFLSFILLIALIFQRQEDVKLVAEKEVLALKLDSISTKSAELTRVVDSLQVALDVQLANQASRSDQPPILILSEDKEKYRFASSSYNISKTFRQSIASNIVPILDRWSKEYDCDAVMVIGHTDGEEFNKGERRRANLDETLVNWMNKKRRAKDPTCGSNVDLGIARAIVVMNEIRKYQGDTTLTRIKYWLPYSAGQLVKTNDHLQTVATFRDDRSRRRIEIVLHRHERKRQDQ